MTIPPKGTLERTKLEVEAYTAWRAAEDAWNKFCSDGEGKGPALATAAAEAEHHFLTVYEHAS